AFALARVSFDLGKRLGSLLQTESYRPRETRLEQQEFENAPGIDAADSDALVRLVGQAAAEHGGPVEIRHRQVGLARQVVQELPLDLQDAQDLVGPLEKLTQLDELPAFVPRHGGVADALEHVAANLNCLVEIVWRLVGLLLEIRIAQLQVKLVQFAP